MQKGHSSELCPSIWSMSTGLRALILLASLFLSLPASPVCSAYPAGHWKRDGPSALRFEQAWLQVPQQNNVAALDCMLAHEFADTSLKGEIFPKAQVLKSYQAATVSTGKALMTACRYFWRHGDPTRSQHRH